MKNSPSSGGVRRAQLHLTDASHDAKFVDGVVVLLLVVPVVVVAVRYGSTRERREIAFAFIRCRRKNPKNSMSFFFLSERFLEILSTDATAVCFKLSRHSIFQVCPM